MVAEFPSPLKQTRQLEMDDLLLNLPGEVHLQTMQVQL
jgi:hypothetical protein